MKVVVVPNELSEAIHRKIEAALAGRPMTSEEREIHFNTLLEYFDRNGVIPDFEISPTNQEESE